MSLFRPTARFIRPMANTQLIRPMSISAVKYKTATDTVKDAAKTVDRAAADAALKGIEVGENITDTVKQTVGVAKEESPSAEELKGKAKGSYEQAKGQAKGTYEQAKGQAKGTAEEAKGKMQ